MVEALQLGLEFGGGGILGFLIGFATKKIAKLIAIIIGLELALFKFLETKGVLKVNWDALASAAEQGANQTAQTGQKASGYVASAASALPIGGGFALGAFLGFKKG